MLTHLLIVDLLTVEICRRLKFVVSNTPRSSKTEATSSGWKEKVDHAGNGFEKIL